VRYCHDAWPDCEGQKHEANEGELVAAQFGCAETFGERVVRVLADRMRLELRRLTAPGHRGFGKDAEYGSPNLSWYGGTSISAPMSNPELSARSDCIDSG
jgi:hypothetical protein